MRLKIYFSLLLLLMFLNMAGQNKSDNGFVIHGVIKGVDSGVVKMFDKDYDKIEAEAVIKNGVFLLSGNVEYPQRRIFTI